MTQTGILDTFIPKEWAVANGTTPDAVDGYLALQTLNKVFEYNCTGDKVYDNCWDFVAEGTHALFMDIDSEVVGKNFLYMLTEDKYAAMLRMLSMHYPLMSRLTSSPRLMRWNPRQMI